MDGGDNGGITMSIESLSFEHSWQSDTHSLGSGHREVSRGAKTALFKIGDVHII